MSDQDLREFLRDNLRLNAYRKGGNDVVELQACIEEREVGAGIRHDIWETISEVTL